MSSERRTNIECEGSDKEEEYTSDECEDVDEDGVKLDISYGVWSTTELQLWEEEQPWEGFVCDISFWSFLCASSSSSRLGSLYTFSSYSSRPDSLEGVRTDMDEERLLRRSVQHMGHREMATNLHNNESESGCQSRGQHAYKWEKELKWPLTFQEVFDKTHKKKGTDQYISDRAREVAESYSQQMIEKYVGEEEQPQLDPEVWVVASGAPRKAMHNMDTSRVLSGASSSASQTSAFTTPDALGISPIEMMGFIRDEISGLESRLTQTMQMQVFDAVQA
ncbi:hypothetical protein Taro_055057 [Colocasia esculenta]|uniref:Uncharacterized protein n=1 Tax=Colocasia esculenta TaxID=4460 RepID=A0A843XSH5_COLES|nr:hypothetical protein [Colocasia esculenta]